MISWNVRGLSDAIRRRRLKQELLQLHWDVLLLQETKLKGYNFHSFDLLFRNHFILHGSSGEGRGYVSIVIKPGWKVVGKGVSESGRWIWCDIEDGKDVWRIVNVYAPNEPRGRVRMWEEVRGVVEGRLGMMGGDFNMITRDEDRVPRKRCKMGGEEKGQWDLLMASGEFRDLGEELSEVTWTNKQVGDRAVCKRLDRWYLINCQENGRGVRFRVCNERVFSDHYPIWSEIGGNVGGRRILGRFRADPKWFEIRRCQESIKTMWDLDSGIAKSDSVRRWEDKVKRLKRVIQELSIFRGKKEDRDRKKRLESIQVLRDRLVCNPSDEGSRLELKGLTEEEERFQVVEALRIRRFSRFQWVKEGDLPTKFFFKFLKNRGSSPKIRVLDNGMGEEIEDEEQIRGEFSKFYSRLYQSEDSGREVREYLESVITNKLSVEDRDSLERAVDGQEIERVVKGLAKGKSPGLDGVPNEFYQRCWDWIKEDLEEVVRNILKGGGLSRELNQSLIVLVPKVNNSKTVKDFRPISLLGGIYKIIAKVLANRIRLLVPKLVHPSQAGFVKGRSLAESCLSVWAGMEESPRQGDYVFLKIDFEKAYDRLEWRFLEECLEVMGFGSIFRGWVKGLFRNAEARVQVNGEMSAAFEITRSVRQGCPLAPLLFALATEPLIRSFLKAQYEGLVSGVRIGNSHLLTKMFADDTILFLEASEGKVKRAWGLLEDYCHGSGQLINKNKTKALWLSYKQQPEWSFQWGWEWVPAHTVVEYLGCPTGFGVAQSTKDEWLVDRVRGKVGKWQNKSLSMPGRVIVVNHIIGGMMNFYLGIWSLSKAAIARVNRLLGDFIWGKEGGKGVRVGWSWCALPKALGGLGVPNIIAKGQALAAKWVPKALDSSEPWAEFFKAHIRGAEFKVSKGWSGVPIEDKVFGDGELEVRGDSWVKRLWFAWVSAKSCLDFKGLGSVGGLMVKEGCLWLDFLTMDEASCTGEERKLAKKIQSKGLLKWGQLLVDDGAHFKTWEGLKREFLLDRRMRSLVEGRLDRVRNRGVEGRGGDGNWWKRVRWKDGSPVLLPKTKFIYNGLVEGEKCLEKIARGWNFAGLQIDWGKLLRKHWKSKLEVKIKVFFWKVIHKSLPVGDRVSHFVDDVRCLRCGERETIEHICWTGCVAGGIWGGHMTGHRAMVSYSKVKGFEIIPILAWCCWKARNLMVFEGLFGSARDARAIVMRFAAAVVQNQVVEIKGAAGDFLKLVEQGRVLESSLGHFIT